MTTETPEVQECKYCGHDPVRVFQEHGKFTVCCKCGAEIRGYATEAEAVTAWNTGLGQIAA